MMRSLTVAGLLLGLVAIAHADPVTYFEDHFDTGTLNPAWTVYGTGAYALNGSDLEFVTESGDLHPNYQPTYGTPHHLFLLEVPAGTSQWSAVTRVRYNTPNEQFEQVALLAFQDADNSVKISYNRGNMVVEHVMVSEEDGTVPPQIPHTVAPYTDYFWLRLDRNGTEYTTYFSGAATTDPDAVSWSLLGTFSNPMADPMVGIGGWNGSTGPSGELAEFDYARVQIVPEPAAVVLLALGLLIRRR